MWCKSYKKRVPSSIIIPQESFCSVSSETESNSSNTVAANGQGDKFANSQKQRNTEKTLLPFAMSSVLASNQNLMC